MWALPLLGLMAVNRELVAQAEAQDDSERVVLDMDSTESPVHGQQEGSAYNGHFQSVGGTGETGRQQGHVRQTEDYFDMLDMEDL